MKFLITRTTDGEEAEIISKFLAWQGHDCEIERGCCLQIYRKFRNDSPQPIADGVVGLVLWFNENGYINL